MMGRSTRIFNETSRNRALEEIMGLDIGEGKPVMQMQIKPYKKDRSGAQNSLSHVWYAQLAAKLREDTAAGYKAYCKLHFGVPILREDADFGAMYDRIFKPMDYETKLEIMKQPGLFDVTSLMSVEQMGLYLDHVQHHWADRVQLNFSEDAR